MNIKLIKGDITKLEVDAIVNAANHTLLGGGGVDGAIHNAAGPELLKECVTLNGCDTGETKITKGYKLPAKYVIHTVGPIYRKNDEMCPYLLHMCYLNSLNLAEQYHIQSIAFPSISTGVYGYPKKEAADIATKTVIDWYKDNPHTNVKEIIFVAFDDETYNIYFKLI